MASVVVHARLLGMLAVTRRRLPRLRTTATLQRLATGTVRTPVDPEVALRAVRRAARVVGGDCLEQAVALTALLQRSGREPILVLGGHRYADRRWGAHAWVLLDGRKLDPRRTRHHDALAWYRAADAWLPVAPAESSGPATPT